jgi:signal transduction histidine kinase
VRIELVLADQGVVLQVVDNGRGFSPAQDRLNTRHRGLHNMAERAKLIGGRLEIKSRKGRGTRVCLEVPVPSAEC